jgi:hypothetical protein
MGLCKLPGEQYTHHRRLDLIVVPYHEKPFVELYFTGSGCVTTCVTTWVTSWAQCHRRRLLWRESPPWGAGLAVELPVVSMRVVPVTVVVVMAVVIAVV